MCLIRSRMLVCRHMHAYVFSFVCQKLRDPSMIWTKSDGILLLVDTYTFTYAHTQKNWILWFRFVSIFVFFFFFWLFIPRFPINRRFDIGIHPTNTEHELVTLLQNGFKHLYGLMSFYINVCRGIARKEALCFPETTILDASRKRTSRY